MNTGKLWASLVLPDFPKHWYCNNPFCARLFRLSDHQYADIRYGRLAPEKVCCSLDCRVQRVYAEQGLGLTVHCPACHTDYPHDDYARTRWREGCRETRCANCRKKNPAPGTQHAKETRTQRTVLEKVLPIVFAEIGWEYTPRPKRRWTHGGLPVLADEDYEEAS